jgi:CHAD domain-containing protein
MDTPLQKYYHQRVQNIFNSLHNFELSGSEPSLHDVRIELKKLRAVIRFLRKVYHRQTLKRSARLVNHIFQAAGEIRAFQILQEWLKRWELPAIEQQFFSEGRVHYLTENFNQKSTDFKADIKEAIEQITPYVQGTNSILCEQYLLSLQTEIELLLHKNASTTEWHDLRKLMKQWLYANNWIEDAAKSEKLLSTYAFYNKLQEAIGQWHDIMMVQEMFERKQLHLSDDVEVQKDLSIGKEKMHQQLKQKQKWVVELIEQSMNAPSTNLHHQGNHITNGNGVHS